MPNHQRDEQSFRLPFRPHWDSGGYLQDWNVQHPRVGRQARTFGKACAFIGRVGVLAVTFGIGTAIASGCLACASAEDEPGDRGPSAAGAATSTSQSERPGRITASPAGALRPTVAADSIRDRAAAVAVDSVGQPTAAPAPRRLASRLVGAAPATPSSASPARAAMATARVAVPALATVSAPSSATRAHAPAEAFRTTDAAAVGETSVSAPTAAEIPAVPLVVPSTATGSPSSAAVVIASPPAASATIEPTFTSLLAVLSDAMMDTTSVPADAALAVLLGSARREIRSVLTPRAAASKAAAAATTTINPGTEAERMTLSGAVRSVADRNASGGYALALTGAGQASTTMTLPEAVSVTLRLRTAAGAPNMTLSIDGVPFTTLLVNTTSYSDYIFTGGISAGTHVVSISSTTASTRNILYIDTVTTSSGPIIDEFLGNSGSAPSRLWTARSGTGFDSGNQTYSAGNAFLDGQGHLVIQATKGKKNSYTSGWVWTKNNLSFGYGTVTAKVKMPKGQGLWPAVWMMGSDSDTVGWPASGEIDIVELPSTTTTLYSTLHGPIAGTTNTQQAQIISTLPDLSTDYHDYWVRHMPDSITFGVDGQTLGTLTPDDLAAGETWVYNRPMYMILNLAVGGSWAGSPNSSTAFPAKMLVESVTFAPA